MLEERWRLEKDKSKPLRLLIQLKEKLNQKRKVNNMKKCLYKDSEKKVEKSEKKHMVALEKMHPTPQPKGKVVKKAKKKK